MDSVAVPIALYALAAWMWGLLIRLVNRDLPVVIYVQQNIGVSTRWPLHWLAARGRWLLAAGATGAAVGLVTRLETEAAIGLLVVSVGLLTYIHFGASRLLDPRVVSALMLRLRQDDPDEPQRESDEPLPVI